MSTGTRVRLRPITLVDEGDDVLLGDPAAGTFVAVPKIGAVVIRALQRGATTDEAAAEAERYAGEPVDVDSFVDGLRELGFVDEDEAPGPRPTAPLQQRRWISAPLRQRHARILFTPVAWACYTGAFAFSVACFAVRPDLWPRPDDVFIVGGNVGSAIIAILLSYVLTCVHETWHWLGARALDLSARFGIDRRMYFLVFETDLSQLWSVPRRQRYGPQLAGLAIDSVILAGLLTVELATGARLAGTLVYLQVMAMLWQCMVFLRTDLYGVLVTATRCRNLWEVKSLLLRRAFGRLSAEGAAELAAADPRDLHIGRLPMVLPGGFPRRLGIFQLFRAARDRTAAGVVGTRPGRRAGNAGVLAHRREFGHLVSAAVRHRRDLAGEPAAQPDPIEGGSEPAQYPCPAQRLRPQPGAPQLVAQRVTPTESGE